MSTEKSVKFNTYIQMYTYEFVHTMGTFVAHISKYNAMGSEQLILKYTVALKGQVEK